MPPPPRSADPALPDAGGTEVCPGCGAVIAAVPEYAGRHPGASPSCSRLFEVTLGGVREEAFADVAAAATARLADAAYDAQHPIGSGPDALDRLTGELGVPGHERRSEPPGEWTTTIADVAADLDVIDLGALVGSWARAVLADWTRPMTSRPRESA